VNNTLMMNQLIQWVGLASY